MGLGLPEIVARIINVLEGTIICDVVLTYRCGGGNVKIWLMCNAKGVGFDTIMDQGSWCECNCVGENQSISI